MTEGSALARTPVEIWEVILDEAIRPGVSLDTTCTLKSFREFRRRGGEGYTASEKQRLVLRRVCKQWKQFAESRAHRRLDARSPLGLLPPSTALRATRVHYTTKPFAKYLAQHTTWQIVRLDLTDAEPDLLRRLTDHAAFHPHLRRLVLNLNFNSAKKRKKTEEIVVDLAGLACFRRLTYLVIRRHDDPVPVLWWYGDEPASPITLAHLEVLDVQCSGPTTFPSGMVHLPTLQHLSLWVRSSASLLTAVAPYGPTLRSLMVRFRTSGDSVLPPLFGLLPKLEELAVAGLVNHTDYPPTGHPIRRLILLGKFIELVPLRLLIERLPTTGRLIISKLKWTDPKPRIWVIPSKMARVTGEPAMPLLKGLAALCELRGIRLEDDDDCTVAETEAEAEKSTDVTMKAEDDIGISDTPV
jgi:hypothetical protein